MASTGTLDSQYTAGERVCVDDDLRKFTGTIVRRHPRNTAEYEVVNNAGRVWIVHWAYLRRV